MYGLNLLLLYLGLFNNDVNNDVSTANIIHSWKFAT